MHDVVLIDLSRDIQAVHQIAPDCSECVASVADKTEVHSAVKARRARRQSSVTEAYDSEVDGIGAVDQLDNHVVGMGVLTIDLAATG